MMVLFRYLNLRKVAKKDPIPHQHRLVLITLRPGKYDFGSRGTEAEMVKAFQWEGVTVNAFFSN